MVATPRPGTPRLPGSSRASSALPLRAAVPLVAATVLVTLAASNLHCASGCAPGALEGDLRPGGPSSFLEPPPPRELQQQQQQQQQQQGATDFWPAERWQLPPQWRSRIVAAFPVTSAGLPWVRASRAWRRGIRAALITDFQPSPELVAEGAAHGEAFLFFNSSGVPFENFGKAAMVPSLAAQHFGDTFDWLLYGDDDTVWMLDSVVDIVSGLGPQLPWFITDHFWFWRQEVNSGAMHPAHDAPRCVPCGFNKTGLDTGALGFDPPHACGSGCTVELLCRADAGRAGLYTEDCQRFNLRYPGRPGSVPETEGELLAHGGAGIILSAGLMRMLTPEEMLECIRTRFTEPGMIHGGDTLFSHCVFHKGVAPTDPGHFVRDPIFSAFDPGGQNVRNIIDLLYSYIKKDLPDAPEYRNSGLPLSCCDALCQARLRALTTVHLRGLHFKEPEAAMAMLRLLVDLRDIFLLVRARAEAGGHPLLPPAWDNHKVCA